MDTLFLILSYIIGGNMALVGVFLFVNTFYASKGYQGKITDHFDGKRFYNIGWTPKQSLFIEKSDDKKGGLIYWILHRNKQSWKEREITQIIPEERIPEGIKITYIGHATVLIQVAGINIITDPVFSDRASPFSWLGPKRFTKPGVTLENLPPIDIILLSHNHYDHMDIASLRSIQEKHSPKLYSGLGNKLYMEKRDIHGAVDMDWWEKEELVIKDTQVHITYLPAQHFSARGLTDRNRTLWGGFRLEVEGKSLYFAGDTGYGLFVEKIREKFPDGFDVGLIPIGAYKPRWFMAPVHTDPFEGMQIQHDLGIKKALGIHYGTFDLADDNQDDPVEDLEKAKKEPQYRGQQFEIGPSGSVWNW